MKTALTIATHAAAFLAGAMTAALAIWAALEPIR